MAERIVTELIVQGAQQFINDFASAGQAVNTLTTRLQESERIRTPHLAPQIEAINAALQKASKSGVDYVQTLTQIQQGATQVTQSEGQKAQAINAESDAHTKAKGTGITYLSTLSAIHAASFLLSNRTFTLVGSFFTLGAAFSKLGGGAVVLGAAFGGFLFIFGQVQQAAERIQQAVIGATQALGVIAVSAAGAVVAAGGSGIKIAADVQTGLAGLKAFGGATAAQLEQASTQATQLGIKFGIASKDVVESASLFARAGGSVQEALDGATEAILKLQVASKGEIDAAQAAIAVSAGIRQFSLTGADAIRVADALAGAAQASALSFTGVTQAFVQAAPGAKTLNISLEDLAATIALLGNQLIKGNITGTSFKQFILDLINPSKQAKSVLDEFGISIQDSSGKIRPLADVLTDLNAALGDQAVEQGRVTEAVRATAIAQIFGSRAGLAANILTREGAQGLQAFRDALAATTATNITDILLLPLNKQLERLVVVLQEVGRAFGGPLLEPIRAATVAGINFFTGLLAPAKLLGQALSVIITGSGFGQLQEEITKLTGNSALSSFLIELVNVFRNVQNVIVTGIIPAIQSFVQEIVTAATESGRLTDAISVFDSINKTIQFLGAAFVVVSKKLADFVVDIIHNEGRGKEFRETIANIATTIINNLVTSLVTSTAFFVAALTVMSKVGEFIRGTLIPNLQGLGEALVNIGQVANSLLDFIVLPFTALGRAITFVKSLQAGKTLEEARADAAAAAREMEPFLTRPSRTVFDAFIAGGKALQGIATTGRTTFEVVDNILSDARANAAATIKSFQDLGGEIPDALSNLRAEIEALAKTNAPAPGETVGAPGAPNVNAVKQAQDKVVEAGRDFVRRLAALQEDVATKAEDISARAVERIGDIFDKANVQLAKLTRDTQEKVDDLNKKFQESRTQSQFLTQFQRQLDDRTTRFQRAVDAQVLVEQRGLEDIRTARQRDTEDVQRNFDLQLQAAERVFTRQQQDAETAFSRVQAARERAFSKQQDSEEKALQRQLEDEATRRQNAIELAGAAPNDRANVLARQRQAASDIQFQRGQQAQLEALRLRQESARIAFQQQQENAQTAFRRTQEDTLTRFRQAQELLVIDFRRKAEDNERTIRRSEEDAELVRRIDRENRLLEFRRNNEDILARVHDFFSLKAHNEELDRIRREASERRSEIIADRNRQVGEIQDQVLLQFRELDKNTETGLRAIQNSFQDLIENIPDNVRGVPAVAGAIAQVQDIITRGIQTSQANLTDVKDKVLAVIEATRTLQEAKVGIGAGLGAATQIDMRTIEQPIANGFVAGLQIAHDRGLLPTQTINITVAPTEGANLQDIIRSIS